MSTTKRTPAIKEAMSRALLTAIEYLDHEHMPSLPRYEHPQRIARQLESCIATIQSKGSLRSSAKKFVLGEIQIAADYLSNPKVAKIPFALRTTSIARMLREVIGDLK
jgi:hypothetical protein